MLQSRPPLKNKKAIYKSLLLLIISIMLIMLSPIFNSYGAIAQLVAFILAVFSLLPLIKHVIPDYLYTITDDSFTIHKVTKSQSVCIASVELSKIEKTIKRLSSNEKAQLQQEGVKLFYYTKNPDCDELKCIVFSAVSKIGVIIDPEDAFFDSLIRAVEQAST